MGKYKKEKKERKMKLWGGRFTKGTAKILEEFNGSINFDKRMYGEDIRGSIAHSKMLAKQDIIEVFEQKKIEKGLLQILGEIEKGNFVFDIKDEDIHMSIEKRLIEIVGEVGGKLHTARSRNDQVALDIRMYLKKESKEIEELLGKLLKGFVEIAKQIKRLLCLDTPIYRELNRYYFPTI